MGSNLMTYLKRMLSVIFFISNFFAELFGVDDFIIEKLSNHFLLLPVHV